MPPSVNARRRLAWSLGITREVLPEGLLVTVAGRLGAPTSGRFASVLDEIVMAGHRNLLVDLSGVDYLSSAGLSVIERIAAQLQAAGGSFVLCGLQEPVRVSFEISGAGTHLTITDKVDEGRRWLESRAAAAAT